MKYLIFIVSILLLTGCEEELSFLSKYTPENPAKVKFTFEITDNSQRVIADSISCKLVPRLQVFSKERGDFILVKSEEPADFILNIKVTEFQLVTRYTQKSLERKRNKIEDKYEPVGGANTGPPRKFISKSFGYVTIIETDPRVKGPQVSESDQHAIDSTISVAKLNYKATIKGTKDSLVWQNTEEKELQLNYIIPEGEQVNILARNVILSLEDNAPILSLPVDTTLTIFDKLKEGF
jgi:hypothetical protein